MSNDREVLLREEYVTRINRVQDYIDENLAEKFSLLQLSKVANFSSYHFHRIFCTMTGETLFQYIQRIRLEKAAFILITDPKVTITQIAIDCGFANQASFAKAFKNNFNLTASEIRKKNNIYKKLKIKNNSNMRKVLNEIIPYNIDTMNKQSLYSQIDFDFSYTIEVKKISPMRVVYIRHTGDYKENTALFKELFEKLYKWAYARNLINSTETKWLTLCHDTINLTDDNKLRISVCMTIPEDFTTNENIGILTIPGGRYVIGNFELKENQYQHAWNLLFREWLPHSGYQPDDRLCFELYPSKKSLGGKKNVEIYIPIKPL